MAIREALDTAMHRDNPDSAMSALIAQGVWLTDEDSMTAAIHNVYCGIMADHEHPNEKDRDQARKLIAAIGQAIGSELGQQRPDFLPAGLRSGSRLHVSRIPPKYALELRGRHRSPGPLAPLLLGTDDVLGS